MRAHPELGNETQNLSTSHPLSLLGEDKSLKVPKTLMGAVPPQVYLLCASGNGHSAVLATGTLLSPLRSSLPPQFCQHNCT